MTCEQSMNFGISLMHLLRYSCICNLKNQINSCDIFWGDLTFFEKLENLRVILLYSCIHSIEHFYIF